jgi:MFS-type transporter involved in bile tolerance (Atg22 family)
MFEGDLIEGELEIGQIAGLIQEVKSAGIILEMIADYNAARQEIVAIFLIIEIMTKIKLYIVLLFLVGLQQTYSQNYKFKTSGVSVLEKKR